MTAPAPEDDTCVLSVRDLTKTYGATIALRGVSCDLHAGHVYGLIGVNGSGKSTLMKIIAGAERASSGEMSFAGVPYRPRNVLGGSRAGVGMVPQELPIVRNVSVVDNVLLGRWPTRFGTMLLKAARRTAAMTFDRIGVRIDVTARAGDLRLGEQQLTVIARTMTRRPRLVLMDEPTSALAGTEVVRLRQVVRDIAAQGRTVLFVSQRLDDVFDICDHVMVLRAGAVVASMPVGELTADRACELMLGQSQDEGRRQTPETLPATGSRAPSPPPAALTIRGLTIPGRVSAADLDIARGEIVGLAGLPSSGSAELLRALFGVMASDVEELRLFGTPYRASGPSAAIRAGVAYVTGDRQAEGLVPGATVAANIAMVQTRSARGGPRQLARARRSAVEQISALHITPGDPDIAVRSLSGGNQQKALFARWLLARPRLWLLDDATRGVDVGARREIHDAVRRSVNEGGGAALVVSSDVIELFELCDRIVVFRSGAVVAELDVEQTTPGKVEALATGALEAAS
jgi:ribose transport system ATP-binding protein